MRRPATSGAQAVFGGGLVVTGIGLFWCVRVAWTFAVLLLLITIGINLTPFHFTAALVLPGAADEQPPLADHPAVRGDTKDDKVRHKAGIENARLLANLVAGQELPEQFQNLLGASDSD